MKITRRASMQVLGLGAGLAALAVPVLAPPARAVQPPAPPPSASAMVSAVPAAYTPPVGDGDVRAIAKVGSTMVIGGNFTTVKGVPRARVAAFGAATGSLSGFNLAVNGEVSAIVPGPTPDTAYLAGGFTQVGAATRRNVALVNLATNSVVSSFAAPALGTSGRVKDMVKVGNRLVIAGDFSVVGGQTHRGIAALDATTGAVDHAYLKVQFAGHHNDTGTGAQGSVGPWNLDVSPAGDRLAVIGNFKTADGLTRDQVAQLSLGATSAVVTPDWRTDRYSPYCFSNAFDSYVRGVSYSPDGSYLVISATGGGVRDTLCDASARFETYAVGTDLQPTWVAETGGDTVWATEITSNAVYVGGHQRWGNNPFGSDFAGPGAVPRPGLVALDPVSGRPLQWNPGRNPPGKAVSAILATSEGLWVGSNTDYIGNFKYLRKKLALFPYAGGGQLAATNVGALPGNVYRGGSTGTAVSDELFRVGLTSTGVSSKPVAVPNGAV
ncbi:MAG TPA: PKD domain containing protein, partial [Intrasporangium sp.]|nr:PKD domain containing protein [Intrasporangium sp.]